MKDYRELKEAPCLEAKHIYFIYDAKIYMSHNL